MSTTGCEVSIRLTVDAEVTDAVTPISGRRIKFTPATVRWNSYWRDEVSGHPFRHVGATAYSADESENDIVVFGADDIIPAWVPVPPEGWDALVESTWREFQDAGAAS